jgi:hypothetical protein
VAEYLLRCHSRQLHRLRDKTMTTLNFLGIFLKLNGIFSAAASALARSTVLFVFV